jgi:hypothetical protein
LLLEPIYLDGEHVDPQNVIVIETHQKTSNYKYAVYLLVGPTFLFAILKFLAEMHIKSRGFNTSTSGKNRPYVLMLHMLREKYP